MWPLGVVLDPPRFNDLSGMRHRQEPVFIQAFVPELAVEAFNVRVLIGLPGSDEHQVDTGLIRPGIEHLAFELRAVIHRDCSR